MPSVPNACIIGAGSSGITVAKALAERGVPFDCFEKSDRIGGNWVFGNRNGMSSAYRTLHINTSRERMEYSDFPMDKSYPDFPHHSQIARYFDDYVDHFGIRDAITFQTGVERAALGGDGAWEVELDGGETRRYDMLAVANGHHWDPRWPEPPFEGSFDGVQMHAHHYVDHKPLEGRNVVVLGMGNSAMDIAVESSLVARRTFLAARRGVHVMPKYIFGRPLDQVFKMNPRLPFEPQRTGLELVMRAVIGPVERYGLPKPDHRILGSHPTISDQILTRVTHGEIEPKPNIAALEGSRVRFADGSVEDVDVIIYCTGYKVTFPFFDADFISAPDNELALFHRVFKPGIDNLAFIGLLQPIGAIMPLAEAQGRWIASYLRGEYRLPPRATTDRQIARDRRRIDRQYVASKRHTMEVDFEVYLHELGRELRAGARRARERDYVPQVAARAHAEQPAV